MELLKLCDGLDLEIKGNSNVEITGITYDSRKIMPGYVFAALHGSKEEGGRYISDALSRGASAVLCDDSQLRVDNAVVLVTKGDVAESLGKLSSKFYGNPSKSMKIFAVTGTNGKTTITYMLEKIFRSVGKELGIVGTIAYRYGQINIPAPNTTPQSSDLHKVLRDMKDLGAWGAAMEVSSHGLVQNRIAGCDIDTAIFTNLTHDHLDYHKTMEDYKKAKCLLFDKFLAASDKPDKYSVVNTDDPCGKELSLILSGKVITYGLSARADVFAKEIHMSREGTEFIAYVYGKDIKVKTKLMGKYNIYNALAAFGCALTRGLNPEDIAVALSDYIPAPGRCETINLGQPFSVIIDYAHTPDALQNVLSSVKEIKHNRIITVFGCGGDRDRSKRPLMGEVSAMLSDFTIITSDNPRSESAERILLDIEVGFQRKKNRNYEIVVDRASAIKRAVDMCMPDDILIIAGKGHEDYFIIGNERLHFSDKETAENMLLEKYGKNRNK